jgi:hypothetical protein
MNAGSYHQHVTNWQTREAEAASTLIHCDSLLTIIEYLLLFCLSYVLLRLMNGNVWDCCCEEEKIRRT